MEKGEPEIFEEKIKKKDGEIIIKKYIKIKELNSFKWIEVINPEKKNSLAMKIIKKNDEERKKFKNWLKIHKSLHHKNIINLEHNFEDSENFYLLTEICHNGSLHDLIQRRIFSKEWLSELEVKYYLLQIIDLLIYFRGKKIIHRNLNIKNLLISDKMEIKLNDFSYSIHLNSDKKTIKGSVGDSDYNAPEMEDKENSSYSYEVDIWSLGIIMYKLIFGKIPLYHSEISAVDDNLLEKKFLENQNAYYKKIIISENAKDLIKRLLKRNPKDRIKLEEISKHPFLNVIKYLKYYHCILYLHIHYIMII